MSGPTIADYMARNGYVDEAGYNAILSGTLGVHPTFFYESVWNLAGLVMVYFLGKKRKFDGQCFLFYVFWYGLGRAWIEGLRTDSLYFFGLELFGVPIRTSQALAAISAVVAGAVLLFLLLKRGHSPEKLYVNRLAAQRVAGAAEQECQGPDTTEDGDEDSEDTTQKEKNEEGRGEE